MDEWETNFYLCTSAEMRWTLKTEHPWVINVVPNPKSHRHTCGKWVKSNKTDISGHRGKEAKRKWQENKKKLEAQGIKHGIESKGVDEGFLAGVDLEDAADDTKA